MADSETKAVRLLHIIMHFSDPEGLVWPAVLCGPYGGVGLGVIDIQ